MTPKSKELPRFARDLLAASQKPRDLTRDEKRRAVESMGLLVLEAEAETRICRSCDDEFELLSGFYVKGHDKDGPLYNARCKHCCLESERERARRRRNLETARASP